MNEITQEDRNYASELIADLDNADLPRLECAARWFRKARLEQALVSPVPQPAVESEPGANCSHCELPDRVNELVKWEPGAMREALEALHIELQTLKAIVCDSRYSNAAIGMRVRNCWPCYEDGVAALSSQPSAVAVAWREVEMVRLIDLLRAGEGDSVTLICDNPDFNGQPNCAVICNGDWTHWKDRRFAADTLLDALSLAATEKQLPAERPIIAESNGHHWIEAFNMVCCRDCGIIRRADDQNKPCKGAVGVGLRLAPPVPAAEPVREEVVKSVDTLAPEDEHPDSPHAGEPGAMREAVIEECAKIAEKLAEDPAWSPHYKNASIAIADKIRRLAKRAALASAPQPAAGGANISDFERVFRDACDEAGCEYDNEALLFAIAELKSKAAPVAGAMRETGR